MAFNKSDHVGFVKEPNCGRGTVDILWQCLARIFLCVYTALHLNVPAQPLSTLLAFLRKLLCVTLSILAPEFVVWRAVTERLQAHHLIKFCKDQGLPTISLPQAHFILAGGMVIMRDKDSDACVEVSKILTMQDFE